jgi:hypothetical protein
MSQAGLIDIEGSHPQIATQYDANVGFAIPLNNVLEILGDDGITTSGSGNTITISLTGGDQAIDEIGVDASTAPGTNPVLPDAAGRINVTGGQVSSSIVGANVIRTDSISANAYTIEIQQSGSNDLKDTSLNGVSHFNSDHFIVSDGFVSLIGGGLAIDSITVDTFTAPGSNPLGPNPSGNITITGAQVAASTIGANVIRTDSLNLNSLTIEIQRSTTSASTDSTKNGVSHFSDADFDIDSNGFVTSNGRTVKWQTISANQTLVINTGYFCISPGGALSLALPATAIIGDIIEVTLDGSTSWTITQSAGQQIRFGNVQTTSGAGGSISSTASGDTIRIVAQTATKWNVISSVGNLTVV